MKKFIKKHKKILGMLLLLLAIAFFIFWEFVGRNELLHEKVIVLNQDVFQGTEITKEMLDEVKIDVNDLVNGYVSDKNNIVGLEARHFIPARSQLILEYFDMAEFVLDNEHKIMKLPNEWILNYPETLRRKDQVYLYAVRETVSTDENANPPVGNNFVRDSKNSEQLFVFNTVVAYVKDNANREVESLDENRLVGTATISVVEVIITDEEFKLLEDYANKGYKFAIMYQ